MDKGLRADLTAAGADFDVTLEKRLMGNEDLYEKCLFMFADSRSTLDNFESFLEKKEYEKAFDEIHQLRSELIFALDVLFRVYSSHQV